MPPHIRSFAKHVPTLRLRSAGTRRAAPCVLAAVLLLTCGVSDAARLLVHTTARSASGHVAGTHHQIVMMDTGHVVAGPVSLRDTARVTRTLVDARGSIAFFGARRTDLHRIDSDLDSPLFIVGMQMAPFRPLPRGPVVPRYFRSPEAAVGRPAQPDPMREFTIDSVWDPSREITLTLLAAGAKTIVELQSQDPPVRYEVPLSDGQYAVRPVAIAIDARGFGAVLTTGRDLGSHSNEPVSWLHTLALDELRPVGDMLTLPGASESIDNPLRFARDGACWVATYSPGRGFAYVNRIDVSERGAELRAQTPFSGVSRPPLIALLPQREEAIVGLGKRIERQPQGLSRAFEAPIAALEYAADELFVGEGGRVHALDPETRRR